MNKGEFILYLIREEVNQIPEKRLKNNTRKALKKIFQHRFLGTERFFLYSVYIMTDG